MVITNMAKDSIIKEKVFKIHFFIRPFVKVDFPLLFIQKKLRGNRILFPHHYKYGINFDID